MGEATAGAPKALLDQLAQAEDAPRVFHKDGSSCIKTNALPQFFNTWSRSARVDLLNSLPEEEEAGAELEDARDEFLGMVSRALLTQVTLGECSYPGTHRPAEVRTERRSLINWCRRFAKIGPWQSVRSYRCWCREQMAGAVEKATAR